MPSHTASQAEAQGRHPINGESAPTKRVRFEPHVREGEPAPRQNAVGDGASGGRCEPSGQDCALSEKPKKRARFADVPLEGGGEEAEAPSRSPLRSDARPLVTEGPGKAYRPPVPSGHPKGQRTSAGIAKKRARFADEVSSKEVDVVAHQMEAREVGFGRCEDEEMDPVWVQCELCHKWRELPNGHQV